MPRPTARDWAKMLDAVRAPQQTATPKSPKPSTGPEKERTSPRRVTTPAPVRAQPVKPAPGLATQSGPGPIVSSTPVYLQPLIPASTGSSPGWKSAGSRSTVPKHVVLVLFLVFLVLVAAGFHSMATSINEHFSGRDLSQNRSSCSTWRPGADLRECDLSGSDLRHRDLTGADLSGSDLTSANLTGAVLDSADLSGADLSWAMLRDVSLRDATLSGATVKGVDMSHLNFRHTDLSGIESFHRAILRSVTIPPDADLSGVSFVEADLSNSYIDGANLKGADFSRAKLHGATFYQTVLKDAVFESAEVQDSWFADSDLSKAKMRFANLRHVLFTGSNVSRVEFRGSDLTGASFADAKVDKADFSDANLVDTYFGRSTRTHKAKFDSTVCSDGVRSNDCYKDGRLLGINP